jgi:hypothetical protein
VNEFRPFLRFPFSGTTADEAAPLPTAILVFDKMKLD